MKFYLLLFISILLPVYYCLNFSAIASASEQPIVITRIQTGGLASGTTLQEYIQIYNNSNVDVNITNWCLQFSSDPNQLTAVYREVACIKKLSPETEFVLTTKQHALFLSSAFAVAYPQIVSDQLFSNSTNIPGTNGSIRLISNDLSVVDQVGWGTGISEGVGLPSLSGGSIFQRGSLVGAYMDSNNNMSDFVSVTAPSVLDSGGLSELSVPVDICINIQGTQIHIPEGFLIDEDNNCIKDVCLNITGLQATIPDGYEEASTSADCIKTKLVNDTIYITEVLANAPGSDTGSEFVEIFNPNSEEVDLSGYRLEVGPGFTKRYTFSNQKIGPLQYKIFSDTETGIILPNTTGVNLRIVSPANIEVSNSETYNNASDSSSWALVEDQWIYTNQITPGSSNMPYLEPAIAEVLGVTSVLAPCPSGKYRNLDTGRCRNIETAISTLSSCSSDQYRNPLTNRCNKLVSSSVVSGCPAGQERNLSSNRCKKVSSIEQIGSNTATVADVKVENTEGHINWLIISIALLVTLSYIVYEWRSEIRNSLSRFRTV